MMANPVRVTEYEDLQSLFQRVFGHPLKALTPPQVLALLKAGPQDIVMVLAWDKEHPQHQLVLHRLTDDQRVVFFNPLHDPAATPGSALEGPPRRAEEGGLESVNFDTFRSFFTNYQARCFATEH